MISVDGYVVQDLLHESHRARFYRGRRVRDDHPVIFKILIDGPASPEKQAQFQQEYDLMRNLMRDQMHKRETDAMPCVHVLETDQGMQLMVLEDLGGASLDALEWTKLSRIDTQELSECPQTSDAIPSAAIPTPGAGNAGIVSIASAMKASQQISQEIVLERLLKQLIHVVVDSAGAQRGIVLFKNDGHWYLAAQKIDAQSEASVLQPTRLADVFDQSTPLPLSLLQEVTHSKASIVIHEAAADERVANDPYVIRHLPRSLVAMPILHHGDLTGMLYLENNDISGAFTESRLEVLQLLASQAAISIKNSRLYAQMEDSIASRTAELKAMSLHDGLTGVANRRAFDERLHEELARSRRNGKPLSLLIIDIDHFKLVNDNYGHPIGDTCLRLMGSTLTAACGRASDFVARYGGEEFALLLPDTDNRQAVLFAERVRSAVQKIVLDVGTIRHPVTASIGVAEAKGESTFDPSRLIAMAERCLDVAKVTGRNRVVSSADDTSRYQFAASKSMN